MSEYALEELLWEQERRREGISALERALEQCNQMIELHPEDCVILLRIQHRTLCSAIACLRDIQPSSH